MIFSETLMLFFDGYTMRYFRKSIFTLLSLMPIFISTPSYSTPKHAEGLNETLISIDLDEGRFQTGVLSRKKESRNETVLSVLLPGYPAVVRPVVTNGAMTGSELTGNFLIRARRHLVDDDIAALIVDCHSKSGPICSADYQTSEGRQRDVAALIQETVTRLPSIQEIWLIGTSMGTLSSAFMPFHAKTYYAGAIHTATLTETFDRYPQLHQFSYKSQEIPQFFIHHENDPCRLTQYSKIQKIAQRNNIPLITARGGGNFKGEACKAFTEHGFRGIEKQVMREIKFILLNKKPSGKIITGAH